MVNVKTLALVSAVALAPVAGAAATVTIDSFDTFQEVANPAGFGLSSTGTVSGAGIIGGDRTTTAAGDGVSLPSRATTVFVDGGTAAISNSNGVTGFALFEWDAGGADLTGGGMNTQFVLDVINVDLNVVFDLTVDGITATSISTSSAGNVTWDFSSFAGANLGSASEISLLVSGPTAFDAEIDFIGAAAVPLPAGGLLLGSILLGGGFAARRKAKAKS